MKTLFIILISTLLFSALSGCVIVAGEHDGNNDNWRSEQRDNRELISNLKLNITRSVVFDQLGVPSYSDAFAKGSDEYRILYYRTQHTKSDGETTKDETTPLVFKNNKLVGWGHHANSKFHNKEDHAL